MSNKMAPDLGKLDELAKVHALSYASPHHFTMSVNGLREVIAELQLPAGNKMALDALTAYQAAGIGNSTDFAKQAETLVHVEDDIRAFADATCAMRASSGAAQAVRMLTEVRFCYESMKPIEDFDAIYAEYATTFCRYPDDFMAKVVRQTKEDLFMWWGAHREKIRAGLVLLAAQEDANRTIPADGKIGGAA